MRGGARGARTAHLFGLQRAVGQEMDDVLPGPAAHFLGRLARQLHHRVQRPQLGVVPELSLIKI
ncbi:hypothetical protein, partial [Corallococcus exiguus]|uniref:hypothetical protein n=1 Tax=Corallococcus exiguus TaxID=83462 RepID=UPI0015605B63